MTAFSIAHDFEGEPADYWRLFFHEPYNVDLYRRLKMKERTILDRQEDDQEIRWSVRVMPERDLPGFLKKILGGDLGYVEHSVYKKGESRLTSRVEPTLMKERTKIDAAYTVEVIAPGRLRRTFAGTVTIDLPLVGKKIEQAILADMQKSYATTAEVTREWLARGGAPAA